MTSERLFNSFIPPKNFYTPIKQISGYATGRSQKVSLLKITLEVRGRARREAARRRKSEWKVNLLNRNSPRSNGSWRMTT